MDLIENKWRGVTPASVQIPPKLFRKFDGFHLLKNEYDKIYLGWNRPITDFTGYDQEYRLKVPGKYEISYILYSENFSQSRATFRLNLTDNYRDIEFCKIKEKI